MWKQFKSMGHRLAVQYNEVSVATHVHDEHDL